MGNILTSFRDMGRGGSTDVSNEVMRCFYTEKDVFEKI